MGCGKWQTVTHLVQGFLQKVGFYGIPERGGGFRIISYFKKVLIFLSEKFQ